MRTEEKSGVRTLKFTNFTGVSGLKHAVSTRIGGVSPAPFNALNIGFGTKDTPENTLANVKLFCGAAGVPFERLVRMRQAHTANVKVIDKNFDFSGVPPFAIDNTDALVTGLKGVPLLAMSADCGVSVFYDPVHSVVAVAHSGWRGAFLNIFAQVIAVMRLNFFTRPEDIICGVSPMISQEHYPVKEEVIDILKAMYPDDVARKCVQLKDGRHHFSLKDLLKHQLVALGVRNYEFAHLCTFAEKDLFYSWRRDAENAGRFGLIASLE